MGELRRALDDYRGDATVLEQCRELRENIDMLLRDKVEELETTIELGCGFYAKAFVPDTSKLFVNVGLGFQLEMTLPDASDFIRQPDSPKAHQTTQTQGGTGISPSSSPCSNGFTPRSCRTADSVDYNSRRILD